MTIDPAMLAIMRGDINVGDVTLPYIQLKTPLKPFETVELTDDECVALSNAFASCRPMCVLLEVESLGKLILMFQLAEGCMFASVVAGTEVLSFTLAMTGGELHATGVNLSRWNVTTTVGILNTVES